MKLWYYRGNNFGDQLNPLIFNRLLPPGFLDDNEDEVFLGIGSILGFEDYKKANKKVVFSSGMGIGNKKEYGTMPRIDDSYRFLCVRGPLTAKVLGLNPKLAITDGAALIATFGYATPEKKHDFTLIPHKNSQYKFDWGLVCKETGINFISPHEDTETVIKAILQSKVVMAESLHAAIVADAFRIPWIPFKTFYSVNSFKWKDWTHSLGLPYRPHNLLPLFREDILSHLLGKATRMPWLAPSISKAYIGVQNSWVFPKVIAGVRKMKLHHQYMSSDHILNSKTDALMDKLAQIKS